MTNWRKPILQLSVFLAAFFVLWTLRATVFFSIDESIASPTARATYSNLLKFVLWVLSAAAFAYWLRNASPTKYLGVSVFPRSRTWLSCLAVTAIFLMAVTLLDLTVGRKSFSGAGLSSLATAVGLQQFLVSPLFEELLFRGLVMKELLLFLPAYLASALTSLLFLGVHIPFWLSHGGLTQAMLANAFGVFVFSLVACWLYARSASIWPPTFAHVANNILSSLLVAGSA